MPPSSSLLTRVAAVRPVLRFLPLPSLAALESSSRRVRDSAMLQQSHWLWRFVCTRDIPAYLRVHAGAAPKKVDHVQVLKERARAVAHLRRHRTYAALGLLASDVPMPASATAAATRFLAALAIQLAARRTSQDCADVADAARQAARVGLELLNLVSSRLLDKATRICRSLRREAKGKARASDEKTLLRYQSQFARGLVELRRLTSMATPTRVRVAAQTLLAALELGEIGTMDAYVRREAALRAATTRLQTGLVPTLVREEEDAESQEKDADAESLAAIKAADAALHRLHRALAVCWHPDKKQRRAKARDRAKRKGASKEAVFEEDEAARLWARLEKAWACLGHHDKRAAYDNAPNDAAYKREREDALAREAQARRAAQSKMRRPPAQLKLLRLAGAPPDRASQPILALAPEGGKKKNRPLSSAHVVARFPRAAGRGHHQARDVLATVFWAEAQRARGILDVELQGMGVDDARFVALATVPAPFAKGAAGGHFVSSTTIRIARLVPGMLKVRQRARNSIGVGEWSTEMTIHVPLLLTKAEKREAARQAAAAAAEEEEREARRQREAARKQRQRARHRLEDRIRECAAVEEKLDLVLFGEDMSDAEGEEENEEGSGDDDDDVDDEDEDEEEEEEEEDDGDDDDDATSAVEDMHARLVASLRRLLRACEQSELCHSSGGKRNNKQKQKHAHRHAPSEEERDESTQLVTLAREMLAEHDELLLAP